MLQHANVKQVKSGRKHSSFPLWLSLGQMAVRKFNPPHQARRRFEMANLDFT